MAALSRMSRPSRWPWSTYLSRRLRHPWHVVWREKVPSRRGWEHGKAGGLDTRPAALAPKERQGHLAGDCGVHESRALLGSAETTRGVRRRRTEAPAVWLGTTNGEGGSDEYGVAEGSDDFIRALDEYGPGGWLIDLLQRRDQAPTRISGFMTLTPHHVITERAGQSGISKGPTEFAGRFLSGEFHLFHHGRDAKVFSIREMSATTACPKIRAFQLRRNPLTGDSEWIVVEEGGDRQELEETTSKNLLATTSYLDMLNDSYRNWAFRAAIEKTIKKPCHVLDIG
ncbi:hypothetical protein GW17_00028176 [Ensete ventricosum]|nr:hypothetical protein GW17_00028176 [Ensete ventricosum]